MSDRKHRIRIRRRLGRQFDLIRRTIPGTGRFIDWLEADSARLIRFPVALLMIFGGLLAFLPVLGLWMLPLGLMLLALDLPFLQGPVSGLIVKVRRRFAIFWRRRIRRSRPQRRN